MRKASGATLLYLHGLGNTKKDFSEAYRQTSLRNFTLVAYDFPGSGASKTYFNEISLGIDDLVAITHQFIEKLQLQNVTIIGQSLGGLVGLLYAVTYPKLLKRFINVEGNLTPQDCNFQSRAIVQHQFLGDEDDFFSRIEQRLRNANKPGFSDYSAVMRTNINSKAYYDYSYALVDYSDHKPLLQWYIDLKIPTLYVHGALSSVPHTQRLVQEKKEVVSIANSDHFPTMTNPEDFYVAVFEFMC